jgi:hypothetical protein
MYNSTEEILSQEGLYIDIRRIAELTHDQEQVERQASILVEQEDLIPAQDKEYAKFLLELHASQVL